VQVPFDEDQSPLAISCPTLGVEWQPIRSAPYGADLELAVIDAKGTHALVFPCRRIPAGWLKSGTDQWVEVHPTHWREWEK